MLPIYIHIMHTSEYSVRCIIGAGLTAPEVDLFRILDENILKDLKLTIGGRILLTKLIPRHGKYDITQYSIL